MKKICFVVLLMSFFTGFSQNKDELPAQIKKTIYFRYPDATDISWVNIDSNFVIEFTLFEEQKKVVCDLSGMIIQTFTIIKINDIPVDIKQAIKGSFSHGTILRAERIRTKNDKIHYIVYLEEDGSIYSIRFDKVGTIISIKKVITYNTE